MMMNCPKCQTANPENARFCMNCGAALSIACPICATINPPSAKFCFNCGSSLVNKTESPAIKQPSPLQDQNQSKLEGERRIVTVLFCDVTGSTSMAEEFDPEEWASIMNRAFQYLIAPIAKYQGTVARLMGDAILAFFGAPNAHEDDPQRAILAGLDILEGIRGFHQELKNQYALDFNVRVGINTGLVMVGNIGTQERMEYTAMGDAVNLAARMEQTAQPGTIQIAEDTYRLVASLFDFQPLNRVKIKGKKEPIQAYRVLGKRVGVTTKRGIQGLHSPLVGRSTEFARLQDLLERLMAGQGAIISLIGEAGLGKSRLMAEIHHWVEAQGWLESKGYFPQIGWYEGRSLSYEVNFPYAPFIDILNNIFSFPSKEDEKHPYTHLKEYLTDLGLETDQTAPFLASMLGVEILGEDVELVKYLTPPQLRDKTHQAMIHLIQCLSQKQKLVFLFEDIHWIDTASLELIENLLSLPASAPVILLAAFRPNSQDTARQFHEWGQQKYPDRYTAIPLVPLDEIQSRTLISNLLTIEDLPERVRLIILQKAEGNPFFVEEVIRSLLDTQLVVREDGHWRATGEIEHLAVPDNLTGVIISRLDQLGLEEHHVMQEASIIGREFSYPVLAAIHTSTSETSIPLPASLEILKDRELIWEKPGGQVRSFSFKHVLTQETTYESVLLSNRRQLNLKIADTLEQQAPDQTGEIARHFYEAREFYRALPYLVEAGNRAARTYATTEAIRYYRKAIEANEIVKNPEKARQIYEGLGQALSFANRVSEAVETYQAMAAKGDELADIPMQVSALNKLSNIVAMRLGQFPEAEKLLGNAEQLARSYNDKSGLAEMFMIRCSFCTASGDFHGAINYLSESVEISRSLDHKADIAQGLAHIANTQIFMTEYEQAWQTAQHSLEISRQIGNLELQAEILSQAIPLYHMRAGDYLSAYQSAEEGAQIAHRIGAAFPECMGAYLAGKLSQEMGDYEKAIAWEEEAFQAGQAYGMPFLGAMSLCTLGAIYQEINAQKFKEKITATHRRALEMIELPGGKMAGGTGWFDLGMCALSLGDERRAVEFFQKGLDIPTPQMFIMRSYYWIGLALCSLVRGNTDEAETYLQKAGQYAVEKQMNHVLPLLEFVRGKIFLAKGSAEIALESFQTAEAKADPMVMRPLVRQIRANMAVVLDRLGRTEEAERFRNLEKQMAAEIASLFHDDALRQAFYEQTIHGEPV